jgi:hypothetical protein
MLCSDTHTHTHTHTEKEEEEEGRDEEGERFSPSTLSTLPFPLGGERLEEIHTRTHTHTHTDTDTDTDTKKEGGEGRDGDIHAENTAGAHTHTHTQWMERLKSRKVEGAMSLTEWRRERDVSVCVWEGGKEYVRVSVEGDAFWEVSLVCVCVFVYVCRCVREWVYEGLVTYYR